MIDLTVCIGTSCHLSGAEMVIKSFQKLIKTNRLEKRINLQGTFCMGKCTEKKVNVSINSVMYETSPEDAENFFMSEVVNTVE